MDYSTMSILKKERKTKRELTSTTKTTGGGVSGSIAVPIFASDSERVIGTLGIGKYAPYEFTDAEKSALAGIAAELARRFRS